MKRRICQPTLPANPASPSFPSPILGCLPSFRVSTVLPAGASSCTGHQPFSLPSFLPWMPFADPPRDTTAPTTSFDPSDAARTLMSRTKTLTIWVSRSKNHPWWAARRGATYLTTVDAQPSERFAGSGLFVDGTSNLVGSYRVCFPRHLALPPYSIHRKQTKNATI
jgi:hypothetical protein